MEGIVEGKRRRGRPEKQWIDNIKEWTMREIDEIMKKAREDADCEKGINMPLH